MLSTIKKGSTGNLVKVAKYLMNYSAAGKATSSFDTKFLNYTKKWQKEHNLIDDGIIGSNTWRRVAEMAADPSSSKTARYAIQILFDRVAVNGNWNSVTQNAIKTFNKACGLKEEAKMTKEAWIQLIARENKIHKHTINFKQNDVKWSNVMYSSTKNKSQTIGNSGCGPTSLANIIYSLDKNTKITPISACEYAIKVGARKSSGGTNMEKLAPQAQKDYGFSRMIETQALHLVKHCLDCGGYVIVGVKKGYFTTTGHYMTIWSYDDKYIYVDNPISNIKTKREISKFTPEVNYYFCFYK